MDHIYNSCNHSAFHIKNQIDLSSSSFCTKSGTVQNKEVFIMKVRTIPKDVESLFENNEMFFSTTDLKGIINSGNDVFARVSKYSLDQMIGKPHNIVRHPDMPKVVFKLLWDYIQSGKPIVAYVKNMAKDGSYYWVLAVVSPLYDDEGNIYRYISIRIKPASKIFKQIQKLYKELLKAEYLGGIEESLSLLQKRLQELGFDDYDDFMKKALEEELKLKGDILEKQINICDVDKDFLELFNLYRIFKDIESTYQNIYDFLYSFSQVSRTLQEKAQDILTIAEDVRLISLNSSVESYKLGSQGNSFFVLSTEMRKTAEKSGKLTKQMEGILNCTLKDINNMIFYMNISKLGIYMMSNFLAEVLTKDVLFRLTTIMSDIIDNFRFVTHYLTKLDTISTELNKSLADILSIINSVNILIKRLHFLYLTGMVESAHQVQTSFSLIFTQVNGLVEKTKGTITELSIELKNVLQVNKNLNSELKSIIAMTDSIKNRFEEEQLV